MTRYTDLSWEDCYAIMEHLEAGGCALAQGHVSDGFIAYIGRGKLSETIMAMRALGFDIPRDGSLTTAPCEISTPDHLRHDSEMYGVPRSLVMYAYFAPDAIERGTTTKAGMK